MKFNIEKVVIWQKNKLVRELKFEPNKVNVITGYSNTGKTAIYKIIDYCFFASSSKIAESMINEKVTWYGLLVNINDKKYCIARKSLVENKVSNNYFFSSEGVVPKIPKFNNDEQSIKTIIETELGIDESVKVAYGSNLIKANSKISLRYFLLFNYVSQTLLINDNIYIETFNNKRYTDAIPRVFDIATGIETIANKILKEKLDELNTNLNKLERKNTKFSNRADIFQKEKNELLKTAREYGLVDTSTDDTVAYKQLVNITAESLSNDKYDNERADLEKERDTLKRRVRILNDFIKEYDSYKKNLATLKDSLLPIDYLINHDNVIQSDDYNSLIDKLHTELTHVKNVISERAPINVQVMDEKRSLETDIAKIQTKLESLPKTHRVIENEPEKYIFLGALQEKSRLYGSEKIGEGIDYSSQIELLEIQMQKYREQIIDTEEKKKLTIQLIEEIISDYMELCEKALGNYWDYKPVFDYKDKLLQLKKPLTTYIESVGSASNSMFLQLFFSLAIHEVIFKNKSNFVPPFLIIDQFSTPYFEGNERKKDEDGSDDQKINIALNLLNDYIETRIKNGGDFQMIVFEHIPPSSFEEFEHFHLVDKEFKNGHALILD